MNEIWMNWMGLVKGSPYGGGEGTDAFLSSTALVSVMLTALSFYSISIALVYFVRNRRGVQPMSRVAIFAALAMAVGTAFLVSIWMPQHPVHWFDATVKSLTALIAVVSTFFLWRTVIHAPGSTPKNTKQLHDVIRQLEHEVSERRRAEQALHNSQEMLHQLVAYQERVKEDERKRIAREIHDELGQNLMALRIDVSVLQARVADVQPALDERIRIALGHIDTSIKAVRTIINNLRPSVLDLGLHAAIEWQVNEFKRRTGIACALTMDDEKSGFGLEDNRATALFRILQESLTNVARHAQATRVEIDLRRHDDLFCMRISDNGVGIFPGCRRKPNSFGLLGIGERVSTLGGEFSVDSDPGHGTVLKVTIPVDAPVALET